MQELKPDDAAEVVKPSEELRRMAEGLCQYPKSLRDLVKGAGARGPLLIALLLALPFPIPGSLPGAGVVFGLAIALLGFCVARERFYWPESGLLSRSIGGERVGKVLGFGASLLARLERFARCRWQALVTGRSRVRLVGCAVAFLGIVLALPLPPGTNSPPAIGIILLTLGALTRDGVMTGLGHIVAFLNLAALVALGWFGVEGITWLRTLLT